MISKDHAYNQLEQLVERFTEQIHSYKKIDYNETLARRDFIDPFFKALGWDIDNSQGYAEAYREVIHEDKIKIGSATKAPDYSFRLPGGKRLFFVEAKKPSVAVKEEILPAYQVRRYAWSAKLPVSILTDFEEFAVYDCTKKPLATDKASVARIKYLLFKDYLKEFDFLWDTFSKERVLKGSFDKFVASDTHKKGTATVDNAFLASLDEWRKQLAMNIALRNQFLTEDELNFVVQQTLDRVIFLRIAEDRGVEEYAKMQRVFKDKTQEPYQHLLHQFYEADSKYNSGLFDFKKDSISPKIDIDARTLKGIINELYYPVSPYEFSVLSVEILGSAYEQFLGKQIKLSAGHRAVIEEKPEVRKAGGVYYTPQYIVDYIVENTVGKLTCPALGNGGKKPEEIGALKIVDPACGSGSFLLGAYEFLLKWHREHYMPQFEKLSEVAGSNEYTTKQRNDAIKERNKLPLTPDGKLTTAIKKQILLNNIYGVDIDVQAVEVTKLSLLLKCMEGETGSSINAEMRFGERILPTLDNNIKSGNSLVDIDFYNGILDYEPGTEKKVKPFNWQQAFPAVFKQGGFDAVIGNPPYGVLFDDLSKEYLRKGYSTFVGRGESYVVFIEKAISLLKLDGRVGMIVPDTYLNLDFTKPLRDILLQKTSINEVVLLPSNVFSSAAVDTSIIVSTRAKETNAFNKSLVTVKTFHKKALSIDLNFPNRNFIVDTEHWATTNSFNVKVDEAEKILLDKFRNDSQLSEFVEMFSGIKSYEVGKGIPPQTNHIRESKPYTSVNKLGDEWNKLYDGKHIGRYEIHWKENNWINYGPWLAAPRNKENFIGEKILIRKIIGNTLIATYTNETSYCNTLLFILKLKDPQAIDYKFCLGILNSKFIGWYFRKEFQIASDDTFPQIMIKDILQFPLRMPDRDLHDNIVKLVDTILQLHQQKQNATLATEIEQLEQRIAFTDNKINQLVYQLYGLTAEEIRIVEGA